MNSDSNAHISTKANSAYYFGFQWSEYKQASSSSNGSIKVSGHNTDNGGCGKADTDPQTTTLDSDLVGTWKNSSGATVLVINKDGTCSMTYSTYSYSSNTTNWCVVPGQTNSVMDYKILYLIYDPTKANKEGIALPYVYSADKKQISTMFGILTKSES